MPRISILRLTDRDAVEEAIREHDDLGAEAFLARRGFGRANAYFLRHDGRAYDSKAIAGRAYEIQHGGEVGPSDFSGGEHTVAKALERLDFEVTRLEHGDAEDRASPRSTAWDAEEMVLALHWYLRYRSQALDAEHPAVRDLSRMLVKRATERGRADTARARGPVQVARQLAGFGPLDPQGDRDRGSTPSRAHENAWTRWASDRYPRTLRVEQILATLDVTGRRTKGAEAEGGQAARSIAADPAKEYLLRNEPKDPSALERVTPDMLLSPKAERRKLSPRTAAAPRIEDAELFDRANEAHEGVREALSAFLRSCGFTVNDSSPVAKQRNIDFDLAADDGDLRLVIEAKSMPADPNADAARLRMGLGQVLWYRHRFFSACRERRVAVLVVERQPRDHEDWLAACRDVGVVLTWPERFAWLVDECRCARDRG